jgi:CHAD domain-containing protein
MSEGSRNLERFVEENLRSRLERLSSNLRKTEKEPENAEHIHDLRVSIRRYTQGLRVFKHLLNDADVRKMRRRLRTVMDLCGFIRNCDIAGEVLKACGATVPEALQQRLAKLRSHAQRDLGDLLEDFNISKRTKNWEGWLRAEASPNQTVNSTARRILIPLTRAFLDASVCAANEGSSPGEMHQFRLQGKRIRYTLEIFGPVSGPEWEQWIGIVRELQERLGAINDCVTTRDLIADPEGPSPDLQATESAVERLLHERIEAFRAYWHEHLGADERRTWLSKVRKIGKTE